MSEIGSADWKLVVLAPYVTADIDQPLCWRFEPGNIIRFKGVVTMDQAAAQDNARITQDGNLPGIFYSVLPVIANMPASTLAGIDSSPPGLNFRNLNDNPISSDVTLWINAAFTYMPLSQ